MITNLKLAKNEETFSLLEEFVPGYNKDRALNGIGLRLKTEEACSKYTLELNIALNKAKLEKQKLLDLQKKYNTTYPSDNKNCLSTPHFLFNKVKSTMAEIKSSIVRFCPKNSRRAAGTNCTSEQTLSNSYLCNKIPYYKDLYPDIYPAFVDTLLLSLEQYMNEVSEIIIIAQDLITEEKNIRDDDVLLKEIETESRKEIEETAISLRDNKLLSDEGITPKDFEQRLKNAKHISELRKQLYHNISHKDYRIKVYKDVIMRGMANDLTDEESKVWVNENDYTFVKQKVRTAIKVMQKKDDLPKQKMRNADGYIIKPIYIASFVKWCRVEKSHYKDFVTYLTHQFTNAPLKIPNYKSITAALSSPKVALIQSYFGDFDSFANN